MHLDGIIIHARFAVVAELAYAHDSGSCPRRWVRVQVSSTAEKKTGHLTCLLYFKSLREFYRLSVEARPGREGRLRSRNRNGVRP